MSGLLARLLRGPTVPLLSGGVGGGGGVCSAQRVTPTAAGIIPLYHGALGGGQHMVPVRDKSTKPKRRKVHPFHWWVRKNRFDMSEDHLTTENRNYLLQEAQKTYLAPGESPLQNEPWPQTEWTRDCRRTGVLARKIGIYPMWKKDGTRVLTTLLQVCEQNVLSFIPSAEYALTRFGYKGRGYGALIVGAESRAPFKYTQAYLDLFREAGVAPKHKMTRFLISDSAALQPGTPLFASHFRAGDYVNVYGKSIDKGFMGAVKRWGFKGMPKTHGVTKSHNRAGAMGGPRGRILKGKKMPGHEGCERRLHIGLKIWRINHRHNVLWVQGPAIPGATNAFVSIFDCRYGKKAATADNPPPYPTYVPDPDNPLPDEVYDKDMHLFDDPSIVFEEEKEVKRNLKVKAKLKAAGKRR